ncbi:hypothetical protein EV193_11778 [Herbihabitans rhizosphaerae]|uniref:Uncharacterized protein n=1 Tax=Herbihabitans rhizosphaerae TaxID=1872711 RepID=A0A4Q7KEB3_9PSEU|nr:hypothetical protein [Herbihabitans rhizosphaerae]RZS30380.1 hypothetical protein EV193_11778 [Herbihabitans rhizosphaerae]
MGKETPPELRTVLRRLEDITDMHKERIDFIKGRWDTLRHKEPADAEAVRKVAESPDASPELKAVAKAVADGKTTWEKAVKGEADHLPEVQVFYQAERVRMVERIRAATEDSAGDSAGEPAEPAPRRPKPTDSGLDEHEPAVFQDW